MKTDSWFNIYDKLLDIQFRIEDLFLNEPCRGKTLLHANYDKLLHILGSFTVLLWLNKVINPIASIVIVLALSILKTIWNYKASNNSYNPIGDWVANAIGVGLWLLWNLLP